MTQTIQDEADLAIQEMAALTRSLRLNKFFEQVCDDLGDVHETLVVDGDKLTMAFCNLIDGDHDTAIRFILEAVGAA